MEGEEREWETMGKKVKWEICALIKTKKKTHYHRKVGCLLIFFLQSL